MSVALKPRDYKSAAHVNWCPGCGDYGILSALQQALAQLQLPPHRVAIVSGIGCSGKTAHYMQTYAFHTLHGRSLPPATGLKLANRDLTVIAVGGDGDGFGIGAGYFVNAARRNVDLTYVVNDNHVYGLTKGQASPTLGRGERTKGMAAPSLQDGLNPIALAVSAGYTFVARGYSLDPRGLAALLADAVRHRGSSFVDVLQTCPTYNDLHTAEWYAHNAAGQPRLYRLEAEGYDGAVADPQDAAEVAAKRAAAIGRSFEWGERIPLGVFFRVAQPTLEDGLEARIPAFARGPLAEQDLSGRDLGPLLDALR